MKAMKLATVLAGALALTACAAGGATRDASYSEADQVIMGVFEQEEMSCPRHTTMLCMGTGRLNMRCSCENPQGVAMTLSQFSGYYW